MSTTEQRNGPEAQRAAIEAWAAREGVQVAAWHVDQGVGGATTVGRRPALLSAIAALREHSAGLLVVAKRDRLARDVVIAATAERIAADKGARSSPPTGRQRRQPRGRFHAHRDHGAAAYERGLIRARTKAALAAKAARGECVGQVPYGFRREGAQLVAVAAEQATIATARELSAGRSLRKVAAELTARGLVSRTGRPFAAVQVARMLARVAA